MNPAKPGFNPLPPTRTGETKAWAGSPGHRPVSIHSRPPGREKPRSSASAWARAASFNPLPPTRTGETCCWLRPTATPRFQSTPAHQDGRNLHPLGVRAGWGNVSIHSRPPGREKLINWNPNNTIGGFQSTPAHQDGRNVCGPPGRFLAKMFQSTPAHQDGRNRHPLGRRGAACRFQSTPAHQDGRNVTFLLLRTSVSSFNPLPPTRTGETSASGVVCCFTVVSIHSRPPGREKPVVRFHSVPPMVSIHSRPPGREKPYSRKVRGAKCGFNPLPPTRTGETGG